MARQFDLIPNFVLYPENPNKIGVQTLPLFKNYAVLHEKYVEKGWSAKQIAKEFSSSHATVLLQLREFGIKMREKQEVARKPGHGLSYGQRVEKNRLVPHKGELENIKRMEQLKSEGFNHNEIADILNALGIPTKTGKAQWQGTTVTRILNAAQAATKGKNSKALKDDVHPHAT